MDIKSEQTILTKSHFEINAVKLQQIINDSNCNLSKLSFKIGINCDVLMRVIRGKQKGMSLEYIVRIADFANIVDIRELIIYDKHNY